MEGHEHLSLLGIADALDSADHAGALRHEKLLMVVGVVVSSQHDEDWSAHAAVNVAGNDSFKHCSFEDAIEATLIGVEIVAGHRVGFSIRFRLLCRRELHAVWSLVAPSVGICAWCLKRIGRLRNRRSTSLMGEVDSDCVAVDCISLLLLSSQGSLLRFGLRLRDIGDLLRCIWTIAIDCGTLCR